MTFFQKHKRGIIGTAIFHLAVLLMLIFLGFFTPLPLPGEEGILVNFGTSEQGLGQVEPRPQPRQPQPTPPVQQEEVQPATPPPQPATTPPPVSQPEPAEEVAMTQDYEETAAIDAAEKKRQEEAERQLRLEQERQRQQQIERQRQAEIERQKNIEAEAERQRQAEIDRQRQADLERQRQAELERQRQAEAERKRQEEEQRRIAEINSRAQGAFGDTGTGGQGTGDNQSQGATFPGGNQGVPTGDPNAGTYGQGGSGTGDQGTGISYDLSGRTHRSLPKPVYPGDDEGLVVVKVTVDKNGNVTAAEPGARGTTIMNQRFWSEARQAALKAKFNTDENAPAFQQGTISYRFRLN
jgi:colicin import membrane protein